MAQRMESVAPAGGVMVSESTARLVASRSMLGERELVHIKGAHEPVPARRLLAMATGRRLDRAEPSLVGRQWELDALTSILDRSINGNGSVVGIVGPVGIGKSRIVREITSLARGRGVDVFATFCESHTTDVAFHAAAGLLRAALGANGLDDMAARSQVRQRLSGIDNDDLVLLDDLLGIGDPAIAMPQIDPDARRRRLSSIVNAAALARVTPSLFVIEDVHWVDGISESMLAEFLNVVPETRSLVLITYRPEYTGALAHAPRTQTIALEPLDDSQMTTLSTELLGADPSVTGLADVVATRAAGNPFFAEEIVRDLTERDVLIGGRGCYLCADPVAEVSVPQHLAGRDRRAYRPPPSRRQADAQRRRRHRISVRSGDAEDVGHRRRSGRTRTGRAGRPDRVDPTARVRIPAFADPRRGLRIAAQIGPGTAAPAVWRRPSHRRTRTLR